jgi:serine/threonine-protein kinase
VATPANEMNPRFSPDGKWVAFLSDESGRSEVYVRSFPDPTSRVQISAEGAQEIVWSDDGKTIYYRSGSALLTATVEPSPFRVVRRDTLLTTQMPTATIGASYDVARDGRILTLFSNRDNFELVVSPNWITEFRQRIAASERTTRR